MTTSNWALFEVQTEELLGPQGLERKLLDEIVRQLREKGVECGRIRPGFECLFTHCKMNRSVVVLGILAAKRVSDSSVQCSIHCFNHIPLWKRLFKCPSPEAFCSGHTLEYMCKEVGRMVSSDPRIGRVEWLTREEWSQKAK